MTRTIRGHFQVASAPGNEREAMFLVANLLRPLNLPSAQMERIKTAVAETTLNAMEHGHSYRAELPVQIRVEAAPEAVQIVVTDYGHDKQIPEHAPAPDLAAKLAGEQSPRGWGLFLIRAMVDDMQISSDSRHHIVTLFFRR